jgi:CDP-6-deoxy-D-xylo-4-hexulose-3-dehydrase
MIRVKPSAPFTVREMAAYLAEKKIGNRMLFGGNLLRQPAFVQLRKDNPNAFRVVGMANSEGIIANHPSAESQSPSPSAEGPEEFAIRHPLSAIPSALSGADEIMHTAIFLGTYPGLTAGQIDYEIRTIRDFVRQKSGNRKC